MPFEPFTARYVVLPADDIDTDQIIPARFLRTTERAGLGAALFADWRAGPDGAPRADFPLNRPDARGAGVLVAGANFGCGSSREHAPWALLGWGVRAVIAPSFADIFRSNALKNGLLPIALDAATCAALADARARDPGATVAVDLAREVVVLPDGSEARFAIDAFARHCLLEGVDELGFLLALLPAIIEHERTHVSRIDTRS